MNHFLALRPDADARDRLADLARRLRAWELPARWVHPEDYHLTLAFLGHLDRFEAACVAQAINDAASAAACPHLELVGVGAFAGKIVPRVVYAAIEDPSGAGADLDHDLHHALAIRRRKPFAPHVTLCRPRTDPAATTRNWPELLAAAGQGPTLPCRLRDLALLRTANPNDRDAPRYDALATWEF